MLAQLNKILTWGFRLLSLVGSFGIPTGVKYLQFHDELVVTRDLPPKGFRGDLSCLPDCCPDAAFLEGFKHLPDAFIAFGAEALKVYWAVEGIDRLLAHVLGHKVLSPAAPAIQIGWSK